MAPLRRLFSFDFLPEAKRSISSRKIIRRPQPLYRPIPSNLGAGGYGLEADCVISDGQNAEPGGHPA